MEPKSKTTAPAADRPESKPPRRDQVSGVFGYILMSIAILAFLVMMIQDETGHPSGYAYIEVPILFFITMLGFVFIHPDLLKDAGKNLSTMRIVVFMMINVICMLMLRIGWDSPSFNAIGMTGYWVTIIGFVFGGKVAQSYIESKFPAADGLQAGLTQGDKPADQATLATEDSPTADVAKMAADQNRAKLQADHKNINSVSDTVALKDGAMVSVVAIYISDSDSSGIPPSLDAALTGGGSQSVPTEIITNVGTPRIQLLQQQNITGTGITELGSIGAMVSSAIIDNFRGVLTSGHIYSDGNSTSIGRVLMDAERKNVQIAGADAGVWHFQLIDTVQDLAVAQLDPGFTPDNFVSFSNGGFYSVGQKDVLKTVATLNSAIRKQRTGFILDYNVQQGLPYDDDVTVPFTNIILIGSTNDRENSHPVSEDGDSGGCVYVNDGVSNKLVGLILGCDQKHTFVLPIQDTLAAFHFNLL